MNVKRDDFIDVFFINNVVVSINEHNVVFFENLINNFFAFVIFLFCLVAIFAFLVELNYRAISLLTFVNNFLAKSKRNFYMKLVVNSNFWNLDVFSIFRNLLFQLLIFQDIFEINFSFLLFDFSFSIMIKFHASLNWYTVSLHYCELDNILKYIIVLDECVFWPNNVFKIRFNVHFMKDFVCTNENDFFVYFFHTSIAKIFFFCHVRHQYEISLQLVHASIRSFHDFFHRDVDVHAVCVQSKNEKIFFCRKY